MQLNAFPLTTRVAPRPMSYSSVYSLPTSLGTVCSIGLDGKHILLWGDLTYFTRTVAAPPDPPSTMQLFNSWGWLKKKSYCWRYSEALWPRRQEQLQHHSLIVHTVRTTWMRQIERGNETVFGSHLSTDLPTSRLWNPSVFKHAAFKRFQVKELESRYWRNAECTV